MFLHRETFLIKPPNTSSNKYFLKLPLTIVIAFILLTTARYSFAIGPFDYSNDDLRNQWLDVVERYHFNSNVENLIDGMAGTTVWDDLDYTLRVFPNHPRALVAMARLFRRESRPEGSWNHAELVTAQWYFERAINHYPNDSAIYTIYAMHLYRVKDYKLALKQLTIAEDINPDLVEVSYYLGLVHLKNGNNTKALKYAQKAYQLDYPLPWLRNKLKALGVWKDAPKREIVKIKTK